MSSEVLKAARSEERAVLYAAVRVIFKASGGAMAFAAVSFVAGFLVGFSVGGMAALWWGGLVLALWFAGGALTYAGLRDGLFRVARWYLTERVVEREEG